MNYSIPAYLTPFILTGMIIVIAAHCSDCVRRSAVRRGRKENRPTLLERLITPCGTVCRSRGDVDCWILSATIWQTSDNSVRSSGSHRSWRAVVSKLAVASAGFRHCSRQLAGRSATLPCPGSDLPSVVRWWTSPRTLCLARRFRRHPCRSPGSLGSCKPCTFAGTLCAASPAVEPARDRRPRNRGYNWFSDLAVAVSDRCV